MQARAKDLQERLRLLGEQYARTQEQLAVAERLVDRLHAQLKEKTQQVARTRIPPLRP